MEWTQQLLNSAPPNSPPPNILSTAPSNFAPAITSSALGVDIFYGQSTYFYPMGHDWIDALGATNWQYATLFNNPASPTPLASGPIALTRDNGIDVFAFCAEVAQGAIFWTRWPGNG